jgi:Skp family chaperone for outer membrane proteins
MKKLFLLLLVLPFFMNAQSQIEICDCADIVLAYWIEAKEARGDTEKLEAIKKKYDIKMKKCEQLLEGKSDEVTKKMKEEMDKCPSTKKAEKLMQEMMGESSENEDENNEIYTVCDCADIMLAMMKEAKGNMTDKEKMKAIKKKYEAKIEKCEQLGDGKSEEERTKMKKEMENCPAAKEAEKLMKEMMGEAESDADRK